MPISARENIIQQFTQKAQELTPVIVHRVLRSQIEDKKLYVSVWDGRESIDEHTYAYDLRSLILGLEILWVSQSEDGTYIGDQASQEVSEVIAEAEHTMINHNYTGISGIYWQTSIPNYPEDGQRVVGVRIEFDIKYRCKSGDPYTLID